MVDLEKEFQDGNYMNAATAVYDQKLHIAGASMQDMRDGKRKLVVRFQETPKALVANKTVRMALMAAIGKNTDNWINAVIVLGKTQVLFSGMMRDSIYIKSIEKPPFQGQAKLDTPLPEKQTLLTYIRDNKKGVTADVAVQVCKLLFNQPEEEANREIARLKDEGLIYEDAKGVLHFTG